MKNDGKDVARKQFSQNAADYRNESVFAEGIDLKEMVSSVPLTGSERLLDIGCGAGHTALAFAPYVTQVVGCDLTPAMVEMARDLAHERQIGNVEFVVSDAEHLPFADSSFERVTCRFAAHHFPDIKAALREVSRVLKPGGTFLLVDHYAPEDPELDTFVNDLDRVRDPSHVREHRLSEYQTFFSEADLTFQLKLTWDLPLMFDNWVTRSRTPSEAKEWLVNHLKNASPKARDAFCVQQDERGYPQSFCLKCALIHGITD